MYSSIFRSLCIVFLASAAPGCTTPSYDPSPDLSVSSDLASPGPDASSARDLAMPRTLDERFVGRWLVDQPYHAGYEATFYELFGDGTLRMGSNESDGCKPTVRDPCVTGWVGTPDFSIACTFGQKWYSEDTNTLAIWSECSDGKPRYVRLGFPSLTGRDAEIEPKVLSVGGAIGWSHNSFEWRFCKCPLGTDEVSCRRGGFC